MLINVSIPLEVVYIIIQFLPYKYWYIDKQLRLNSTLDLNVAKSKYYISRFINRWRAAYKCRCHFIKRLQEDIEYRLEFIYIHEDPRPHFCELKPFPITTRFGWVENPLFLFQRTNQRITISAQPTTEELLLVLHSAFV